ncbi:hypothetical protein E8E11_003090 [Didymella keratinophila]|nr:hypothetical protein E8E11_003090 [Didymella keratinophila]
MQDLHSMHQPPQVWHPLTTPSTSLPQRLKGHPPVKGSFYSSLYQDPRPPQPTSNLASPPRSSPLPRHNAIATQEPVSRGYEPVYYTFDDGPRGEPCTSAYYKSWTFRLKVNEGKSIVPKQENDASEDLDDSGDDDYIKKRKLIYKKESLIMIFSRTNVRRASTQRKVNEKLQRFNRRMKFMRKVEGTKALFKWD